MNAETREQMVARLASAPARRLKEAWLVIPADVGIGPERPAGWYATWPYAVPEHTASGFEKARAVLRVLPDGSVEAIASGPSGGET